MISLFVIIVKKHKSLQKKQIYNNNRRNKTSLKKQEKLFRTQNQNLGQPTCSLQTYQMNPLQSRLKSELFQSTQNLKFNILINANIHNLSNQKKQNAFPHSNNKKASQSTLIPLKSFADLNQQTIQSKIDDKMNELKKRSFSQKTLNTHANPVIYKKSESALGKSSSIRKRLLSASSSSKINNQNADLLIEKQQLKPKEPSSKNKFQATQTIEFNVTPKGKTSKMGNYFALQQSTINLQSKYSYSKIKLIPPVKSQRGMNFAVDPSASKQTLQSKLTPFTKNFESQLPLNSQKKKTPIQENLPSPTVILNNLNSTFTLFVKDGAFLKQTSDFKHLIKAIEKTKQKNLLFAQNLESHLSKIEYFIVKYNISSSIDSAKLFQLQIQKMISNWQILNLFSDWKQILQKCKKGNKPIIGVIFYYPNEKKGRNLAANKIISFFRSIKQKNYSKKMTSLMSKVHKIQRYWRRALLVRRCRQKILESAERKLQQFSRLQERFISKYQLIKTSRKMQIHIGSLAFEQFKRVTLERKSHYENTQISRIFKALESPDTFVIYVTPFQLSQGVIKYYQRLFKIATGSDLALKEKVYFIYPENTQRISNLCELTTLSYLLYSPKALKRIKSLIKSISSVQNSYIIPSFPSIGYTNLSHELKVPVFSSSLTLSKLYSTKIGYRQIIQQVIEKQKLNPPFKLLKSVSSIFSQKELINTLALLIYKNQDTKRWYLKIDDEFNSRGIAYFNVNSINFLKKLNDSGNDDVLGDLVENQKEIIKIIVQELKDKLKQRLKILNKQVYPTYNQFLAHFLTRGGVIEAAPVSTNSQINQFSVSFVIEPNGDFQILGSFRKLEINSRAVCNGVEYPAKNCENVDIEKIVRHLYRRLYLKMKLFGYFTIDLLFQNERKQTITPYIIGMSCFLTIQSGALFMLKQITKVRYDKDSNLLQKTLINNNQSQTSSLQHSKISRMQFQQEQNTLQGGQEISNNQQSVSQATNNSKRKMNEISILYCPMISLPSLQGMAEFFKKCKFQNIAFDLKSLYGTIFLPLDELECQSIGFLVCQQDQGKMGSQLLKVIEFLSRNYRKENQVKGRSRKQQDEVGMLRGVILSQMHKSQAYKKAQKTHLTHKNCQATFNNLQLF